MAKNIEELFARMSPEARKRADERAAEMLATLNAGKHRCMRCREEFVCEHGPACSAQYDVLPVIVVDASGATKEHCPLSPTWDWIRAYGERMAMRSLIQ